MTVDTEALHRALLSVLDDLDRDHGTAECTYPGVCLHTASAALRAVLEAHKPEPGLNNAGEQLWECDGCEVFVTGPCKELRLIAKAFGVEVGR